MQFARGRTSLLTDALTAPLGPDALCTPEQPPPQADSPTAHMHLPCSAVPDDDSLLQVVLALHDTYCALHGPINRVLHHASAQAVIQRIMHLRRAFVKSCRSVDKAAYALRYTSGGGSVPRGKVDSLQALQIGTCAQAVELSQLCTVSPVVALRHCIAAVYDFGLYFTDFSSGAILGSMDRQGVVPGPISPDTFKALKAGVAEAQGACSAVDHVSVFFDGYAVAGGGSPGLPPLMRFLRWQCAHLCDPTSYIPPWRWHHAGESPAASVGVGTSASTFSPSSVLGDSAGGGLAGIKPPFGMRPRGWSAVEGALSEAHIAGGLLSSKGGGSGEEEGGGAGAPPQHMALQRARTLLQRGVKGGLCAVPKVAGYWWGCAIPQRCLDDTPQEGTGPPSTPTAAPSTPQRRSTHGGSGDGVFSPPKARLDAAGFTPGLVYGRKPAAGCPPAFTAAAAAGAGATLQGGVQGAPPTFHPLRAPPVSATYLASLGAALGTARAFATAVAPELAGGEGVLAGSSSDAPLPPAMPSVLRAGGVGPGMPWVLTPGAEKHSMVDVEGATMPSTPPQQGYMAAPTPRRSTLSTATSPPPPPLELTGAAMKPPSTSSPRTTQQRASYQMNRFGQAGRGTGSRSLQVQPVEVRPAASVQVPRLWCPALFLGPHATPMAPPSSMPLLPSHRAFMLQVGNATALVLVDLRKLLQGHPAGDSALWQQRLEDVGTGGGVALIGSAASLDSGSLGISRRGSLTPAMVHGTHPASAAVAAASAAAMRGAGAADQALQECADTPERNTLGWRLLRWAVRVVQSRLEPVLRSQHSAMAAPFESKSSSTPLYMVYPGIDSDVATHEDASPGLVRLGGGLGPALGVSQRATHGVVASAAVYGQVPTHLLAPLHALHSDMAAPSSRSFLQGPPTVDEGGPARRGAISGLSGSNYRPRVREGLIATRNMGMVSSRSESGLGTVHVVFRKTPSTSVASGHAEALLRGIASGGVY